MPGSNTRPNLRALEVFDAVARHSSLSRAAEELGVTQSAVSHQMRYLTEHVGEKLYRMVGRRAVLTPAGQTLADRLRSIFQSLDRSIAEVVGADRSIVRLALCSSFAPGWLVPRLPDFHASHPHIRLQLQMYAEDPDLTDKVADAFVTTPNPHCVLRGLSPAKPAGAPSRRRFAATEVVDATSQEPAFADAAPLLSLRIGRARAAAALRA
jgi:DNA-binding transcriptional LysR family regulator